MPQRCAGTEIGALSAGELEQQRDILIRLVAKNNKLEIGGADAHLLADFELFSQTKWYSELTVGMIEKVVEKSKVDIKWSSL